jgi:LCP family protein required for cell wall assembly
LEPHLTAAGKPATEDAAVAPRKRRWRSRILIGFALLFSLFLVLAGIQVWRVVDALVQTEQKAYVPLPTRVPSAGGTAHGLPEVTVTAAAQAESTKRPTPSPTADSPTSTVPAVAAAITPSPTPNASSTEAPTKAAVQPTPQSKSPPTTPTPSAATMPTPTSAAAVAQGDGDNGNDASRIDVIQSMVDVAMRGGNPGTSKVWHGKTDLYILVIGVDRRPDGGDQNADVVLLAHIDLINQRVAVVSIPRDLYVQIPGVGPDKINGAYNYGHKEAPDNPIAGVVKVRDTVEDNFNVQIDGYVLVDFAGFTEVVDAAGGIDVNVPYEIIDPEYPTENYGTEEVKFEPGIQHMNGDRALKYVRTRHADSDDQRRDRQWQVMLALFDKGKSFGSIRKADEIIYAAGNSVQTSFQLDEQATLARFAYDLDTSQVRFSSLGPPLLSGGYIDSGAWVYSGDPAAILAFVQEGLSTDPSYYQDNAATPVP